MIWDFLRTPGIVKITPSIFYHKDKYLLEFGWIIWSFVIKLK